MHEIRYSYRGNPVLGAFADDRTFMRGLMGPFGSGKSSACIMNLIEISMEQKPGPDGIRRSRWAVIRNTYRQLEDTAIRTVHDWLPPRWFGKWRVGDHSYLITGIEGCEIELLFRALDRPDHVNNLLSLELTGAWVNEAREIPWPIIEALQGRVGRYPSARDGGPTWFGILMDTNPPDEDSWWFDLFETRRPVNARIFKQPGGMDPNAENKNHLPPSYYENMLATMTPERAKVYVYGQYGFVIDGKPVYAEYNDALHCSERAVYTPGLPIYRGWDFGLTPACVFTQITASGRFVIFDELIADSMGIDRFTDDVLLHCAQHYPGAQFIDYGDPAGESRSQTDERTCFEIMRAKGIRIEPGEQTLTIRIESVQKPLRTLASDGPALLLHPSCKALRKGFMGGYQMRRIKTSNEKYADEPEKNRYSHPHDALQYVATRLFGRDMIRAKKTRQPIRYPKSGVI